MQSFKGAPYRALRGLCRESLAELRVEALVKLYIELPAKLPVEPLVERYIELP
jgi:hypothetical protein